MRPVFDYKILGIVGVLVFIHQDVPELCWYAARTSEILKRIFVFKRRSSKSIAFLETP
jgi:hypothetical protein